MGNTSSQEPIDDDGVWDAERIRRRAPWAEPVAGVTRMDLDDLVAWRREHAGDGWRYELMDGWLIRSPAPTGAAAHIARRLAAALAAAAQPSDQVIIAPDLLEGLPEDPDDES